MSDESFWIFGYGSLVWRPAFPHRRSAPASIDGWARRFWQGSTDHRGLPSSPGRVVTLVSTGEPGLHAEGIPRESCWGSAYEVSARDRDTVLEGLDHRERGGYARIDIEIRLHPDTAEECVVPGLVYIAEPDNQNYLGPAPIEAIAQQILNATGPSGPNPEYVFELAESLRRMGAVDRHVFAIESELARMSREPPR